MRYIIPLAFFFLISIVIYSDMTSSSLSEIEDNQNKVQPFSQGLSVIDVKEDSEQGSLFLNGNQKELTYVKEKNKIYFPLKDIAKELAIGIDWNEKDNSIIIHYEDNREASVFLNSKELLKEKLRSPIDLLVDEGVTYIELNNLEKIIEQNLSWDEEELILYIYIYAYPEQGQSKLGELPYQGISIDNNRVIFNQDGQEKASWSLNGTILDVRLINEFIDVDIKEYEFAFFYQTDEKKTSQLLITERVLPNGDIILFIKGYSADSEQFFVQDILKTEKVYISDIYFYIKQGQYCTLIEKKELDNLKRYDLKYDQSINTWYVFGRESLAIEDPYIKSAWDISKNYHQSNAWITPEGNYRTTPAGYQEKINYHNYNINLQASVPLLLIETLEIESNRLLEDIVHNAKYTLTNLQDKDGFWRNEISVAYLNKAHQLGSEFIDTRMSVDVSLFLLKYGLLYKDSQAIEQAKAFKNYFYLLKDKDFVYRNGDGILYSDYYSDKLSNRTLASLNHSLYEMNYLYTLYNLTNDLEAKVMADEILEYLDKTTNKWITSEGDLFYAVSPIEKHIGKDYINITYMDLFVTKSLLDYMGIDSQGIDNLFIHKEEYLNGINSTYIESQLNYENILLNFDQGLSKKGDIFLRYPLEIDRAEEYEFAYFSYGAYHFVKGVKSITLNGEVVVLDPSQKYFIYETMGDGLFIQPQYR